MSESISERLNAMANKKDSAELRKVMETILDDLGVIRTPVVSIITKITALATAVDVLAAKLNADAGVTDTNYSVANAAAIVVTPPAALTTKA